MDLYDFPLGFRSLVMNAHRTAAGLEDASKLADTIRVNAFDFSRLQQRDQRESFHLITGGDLGDASLAFRFLSVSGIIRASTGAKLADAISSVEATFDVEEAQLASPTTDGVLPFTFTDTTELTTGRGTAHTDPVSGLAAGQYVKERFYARPATYPIITQRRSGGDTALFAVELACPDPRRYIDTAEAVVLNSGNSFSATCPNWNALMGKTVAPVLTIVMSGNGATNLTIDAAADGKAALVLNMAAAGAGTFIVDCATGIITKAGVHVASLRTSAVDTFPTIKPGGDTLAATNTTALTSVTADYRQARG